MSLIMGIDTGGTYTDGVIVDRASMEVLYKAKAFTTKEDLTIGIKKCINKLNCLDLDKISLVCLSTTLATNAIVEDRGGEAGLIMIGETPKGELGEKIPAKHWSLVKGKYDIHGNILEELDEEEVRSTVELFKGKVHAMAISGYASVRNHTHERKVREIVREMMDIPVVCAHELSGELGHYSRTVTAVFNARLIPIIEELMKATKSVLAANNIQAPVMIVKGDGSLMKEDFAKERPIETILSGPAASILGGAFLTGQRDATVLDMGGTTTDIAQVRSGIVHINKEGATVDGWMTKVRAAAIHTFGIGGDSYITIDEKAEIKIGPRKVWPLCVIGAEHPQLSLELEAYCEMESGRFMPPDCFLLVNKQLPENVSISQTELKIIEILKEAPHSLLYIARRLEGQPETLEFENLITHGIIERIAVTPTDILHVQGRYVEWDAHTAEVAVGMLAKGLGIIMQEAVTLIETKITEKICDACLKGGAGFNKARSNLVAVGAPVGAWMGRVAKELDVNLTIPEHAEVANAVGAAVGQIIETVEVLIRPTGDGFLFYAPWERLRFDEHEHALNYADAAIRGYMVTRARDAGLKEYEVIPHYNNVYHEMGFGQEKEFVETRIKVTAIGRPEWRMA